MSSYIKPVPEQIAEYQACLDHFLKLKIRFQSKILNLNKNINKGNNFGQRCCYNASVRYFGTRIVHYRRLIKSLKKWKD